MDILKSTVTKDGFEIVGIHDNQKFEFLGSCRGTWLKLFDFNGGEEESRTKIETIELQCRQCFDLSAFT